MTTFQNPNIFATTRLISGAVAEVIPFRLGRRLTLIPENGPPTEITCFDRRSQHRSEAADLFCQYRAGDHLFAQVYQKPSGQTRLYDIIQPGSLHANLERKILKNQRIAKDAHSILTKITRFNEIYYNELRIKESRLKRAKQYDFPAFLGDAATGILAFASLGIISSPLTQRIEGRKRLITQLEDEEIAFISSKEITNRHLVADYQNILNEFKDNSLAISSLAAPRKSIQWHRKYINNPLHGFFPQLLLEDALDVNTLLLKPHQKQSTKFTNSNAVTLARIITNTTTYNITAFFSS